MRKTRTTGSARVARERENLEIMVRLYCRHEHHGHELCDECRQLMEYAQAHMSKCRFGQDKQLCERCSFGCYRPTCRAKMKDVVATTRPLMLLQHPNMSLRHWLDHFYKAPPASRARDSFSSWGSE